MERTFFRLPAPSLRGGAGGEAVCLFCFLMQSYLYALRTAIFFLLFCVLIVFNLLLFLDISDSYVHFIGAQRIVFFMIGVNGLVV